MRRSLCVRSDSSRTRSTRTNFRAICSPRDCLELPNTQTLKPRPTGLLEVAEAVHMRRGTVHLMVQHRAANTDSGEEGPGRFRTEVHRWQTCRPTADARIQAKDTRIWRSGLARSSAMGGACVVSGVSMAWGSVSDVGRSRAVNEDSALASAPVFVVADGMGGHEAGDVASGLVIERFRQLADGSLGAVDAVVDAIQGANEEIFAASRADRPTGSMGTTAVGVILVDNGPSASWMVFNVGDSRVYRYFDGRLERLSTDHSYVQELVDSGVVSASEARTHPHRNVVTRAVGVERSVTADVWLRSPTPGERFVLCSDGLSSEVDDEGIEALAGVGLAPAEVAASLVNRALDAGGRDNVTVLVLDVIAVDSAADEPVTAPRSEVAALRRAIDPADAVEPPPAMAGGAPGRLLDDAAPILEMPHWLSVDLAPADAALGIDAASANQLDPIEIDDVPSPSGEDELR